jgi:hypothetical protein
MFAENTGHMSPPLLQIAGTEDRLVQWGSRPCKFCAFPGRNLRNLARPSISFATIVATRA